MTDAELKEAALHLLEILACREKAREARDDNAEHLLCTAARPLLADRKRRRQRFQEAASVNLAECIGEIYWRVKTDDLPVEKEEAEIEQAFAAHGLRLTDEAMAILGEDREFIKDERGAMQAAKATVGRVFGLKTRAMFYRSSRTRRAALGAGFDDPRLLQPTAFGVRMGRNGLVRYALHLLDVPDDRIEEFLREWPVGGKGKDP